jgi:glycosyltransferase involved in cell wall biosynthesis
MSVYNGEKYLRDAIESILNQTFTSFEFIIINDGSTDSTPTILNSYTDPRIRLLHQNNEGLTKALNKGLESATGTYIARQDADDISIPKRFENQIDFMNKNPDIALIGTFVSAIDENGNEFGRWKYPEDNNEIKKRIIKENIFCHGSVMFRRECLASVGAYREAFYTAQDYDLWLRISEKYNMANIPCYLYKLRRSTQSITRKKLDQQINNHLLAIELAKERKSAGNDSLEKINMMEIVHCLKNRFKIPYSEIRKQRSMFYFSYCAESFRLKDINNALILWLKSFALHPDIQKALYLKKNLFRLLNVKALSFI